MFQRIDAFMSFVRNFAHYALHVQEVLVTLILLLLAGGVVISRVESIALGDAIYFACITGLSIGYGDITPQTALGKVVSVAIGLIGMIIVGITVAIATRALAKLGERR
jgi:voltage-gated potassium channel